MIVRRVSKRKVTMDATPAALLMRAMMIDTEIVRLSDMTEVVGIIRIMINTIAGEDLAAMNQEKRETIEIKITIVAMIAIKTEKITMKGTIGTGTTMIGDIVIVMKEMINTAIAERTAKMIEGIMTNTIRREGETMKDRLVKANSKI